MNEWVSGVSTVESARQHDGVGFVADVVDGRMALGADVRAGDECDTLGGEQVDAALDNLSLISLHVGHAVHHEPADAIGAFVDGDEVTRLVELVRRGETRGAGSDDRHALTGALARGLGHDPALGEAAVDDGALDGLDRHRVLDDAEGTGAFAWRRAHAPGEFGEVVRLVKAIERIFPPSLVHQLVPLGNLVTERAAGVCLVAERGAAVHAPSGLRGEQRLGDIRRIVPVNLLPVLQARRGVAVAQRLALVLDEPANLGGLVELRGPGHHHVVLEDAVRGGGHLLELRESVVNLLRLERSLLGVHDILRLVRLHDLLVVPWVHLDELVLGGFPVAENVSRDGGPGSRQVLPDETHDNLGILGILNLVKVHLAAVTVLGERAVRVVDKGDAAGHTRGEVPARGTEDDDGTASHVFASVVADALHD
mmetsp:Transcript_9982/g.45454  ORF Transcript_9982/g.45454 Transcript_9982/m.45454 type:complete len:424 (+) Transcript_9982:4847-6118(+)